MSFQPVVLEAELAAGAARAAGVDERPGLLQGELAQAGGSGGILAADGRLGMLTVSEDEREHDSPDEERQHPDVSGKQAASSERPRVSGSIAWRRDLPAHSR